MLVVWPGCRNFGAVLFWEKTLLEMMWLEIKDGGSTLLPPMFRRAACSVLDNWEKDSITASNLIKSAHIWRIKGLFCKTNFLFPYIFFVSSCSDDEDFFFWKCVETKQYYVHAEVITSPRLSHTDLISSVFLRISRSLWIRKNPKRLIKLQDH